MPKSPKKPITYADLSHSEKQHLTYLGFDNIPPYLQWCKDNGFKAIIPKSYSEYGKERLHVARLKADAVVQSRRATRDPLKLIRKLVEDPTGNFPGLTNIRGALIESPNLNKELMVELLEHVGKHTDLLNRTYNANLTYAKGIVNLVRWNNEWIRSIQDWEPKSHNASKQFSSLIRHLFSKYDVPAFMDKCWFSNDLKHQDHQFWFIHLGMGGSVRSLKLPIEYTKKMAHHFTQAPEHYSIDAAIRHGQIIALGGDNRLSESVCSTTLGNTFPNEDFWVTVVRWFIRHPMIDPEQIGPIIDYINNQRFVPRQGRDAENRVITLPPECPNLTMKDRDPVALLKEVEKWHKMLAGIKHKGAVVSWAHSLYKDWELDMGVPYAKNWKRWRVYEMLTSTELQRDGREMKHCIYSYVRSCETGRVSVWSMELHTLEGVEKQLTIEIRNGMVMQARGKFNAKATQQQLQVLNRWATKQNLGVASFL